MTELEQLPSKVDDVASQISHLRTEMRDEFSAVRREIAEQGATLRGEIAEQGATLRGEIAEQGAASAARDEALGIQMRVLHEDVIGRLALLQEG